MGGLCNFLHVLFLIIPAAFVSSQGNQPYLCGPGADPIPLPQLDLQFTVTIEAAIGRSNSTIILTEYYDGIGQRGRIDGFSPNHQQMIRKFSFFADYASDQAFHVRYPNSNDTSQLPNCNVNAIENDRIANFTFHEFPGPNGTVRIGSANDIFQFGGDMYNVTYTGEQTFVRGILCDRWEFCVVSPNLTFRTDYYFSVEGWMHPNGDRVPVQIAVNGLNKDMNGTSYIVSNTYTFTAYSAGAPTDDVLTVPEGLVCSNRKNLKPFPNLDLLYYSFISEVASASGVTYYPFYFDYKTNHSRFDLVNSGRYRMSIIHDFNQGVQYAINRTGSSCKVSAIDGHFQDEIIDETGHIVLASFLQLLSPLTTGNGKDFVYEGESLVRGINTDVWIAYSDRATLRGTNITIVNGTTQLYFTKEVYRIDGQVVSQIPMRQSLSGISQYYVNGTMKSTTFSSTVELLRFDSKYPSDEIFDSYMCFNPASFNEITFSLPGVNFGTDLGQLRTSIRYAFSKAAKASPSQFGNIQLQSYSADTVLVTLLLLDPPANIPGVTGPSSKELYKVLSDAIQARQLKIYLNKTTTAVPQAFQSTRNVPTPTIMSGVVAGCLLGGVAMGALATLVIIGIIYGVIRFRKGNKQGAYSPQKDDI